MAGRETAGIDHADSTLFNNRVWVVVPSNNARDVSVDRVVRLAIDAGSKVIKMTSAGHDVAVAQVSHVPFMISTALSDAVIGNSKFGEWAPVAQQACATSRDLRAATQQCIGISALRTGITSRKGLKTYQLFSPILRDRSVNCRTRLRLLGPKSSKSWIKRSGESSTTGMDGCRTQSSQPSGCESNSPHLERPAIEI